MVEKKMVSPKTNDIVSRIVIIKVDHTCNIVPHSKGRVILNRLLW